MLLPGVIATFPWGRGSGKTWLARALIHEWALEAPNQHIGIVLPTLVQARAVFWPILLPDYVSDDSRQDDDGNVIGGLRNVVRKLNVTHLTCEYVNGSRVSTWGAENQNAMRGQRFDGMIQDESDDIDPDFERAVIGPTFSKSGGHAKRARFGTPKKGRHGTMFMGYRLGQEGSPEREHLKAAGVDVSRYVSMLVDSTKSTDVDQVWLEQERRTLIASGRLTTWLREYCCDFDAAEGLVYSMFEQGFHVREPDYGVGWSEVLVGVDHGMRDPGVFLVSGVLGAGKDAIIHCLEEVYETEKDTTWWCDRACELAWKYRAHRQRWYADPSRPDRITDIRKAVRERHPELQERFTIEAGSNEIEAGVDAVADRLMPRDGDGGARSARLYISAACKSTILEMGKYRRKPDPRDPEKFLDEIVDKHNHAMDGLRYMTFTRFGGPDRMRHEVPRYRTPPEPA